MEHVPIDVIQQCKKELALGKNKGLLIPLIIESAAALNPKIVCNELTESIARAILEKDAFTLKAFALTNSLVHPSVYQLLRSAQEKDILAIHHLHDDRYYTSVIRFKYLYDGAIIYTKPDCTAKPFHGNIESNNIIAIAKIPEDPYVQKRHQLDDSHEAFVRLTYWKR
jgi:hypothetical protein